MFCNAQNAEKQSRAETQLQMIEAPLLLRLMDFEKRHDAIVSYVTDVVTLTYKHFFQKLSQIYASAPDSIPVEREPTLPLILNHGNRSDIDDVKAAIAKQNVEFNQMMEARKRKASADKAGKAASEPLADLSPEAVQPSPEPAQPVAQPMAQPVAQPGAPANGYYYPMNMYPQQPGQPMAQPDGSVNMYPYPMNMYPQQPMQPGQPGQPGQQPEGANGMYPYPMNMYPPQPMAQPVQPVAEPVQPAAEPAAEPAQQPVTEPAQQPLPEPAQQPLPEPAQQPMQQPIPESVPAGETVSAPAQP